MNVFGGRYELRGYGLSPSENGTLSLIPLAILPDSPYWRKSGSKIPTFFPLTLKRTEKDLRERSFCTNFAAKMKKTAHNVASFK